MLIYSTSVSVDGYVADREGALWRAVPEEEQFRFQTAQVRERDTENGTAFADIWCALPKVVFSRTLDRAQGNARVADAPVAEEVAAALDATGRDVSIGGAGLAAAAVELVDELRMFRAPVVVGGGTPFLPPVTGDVRLDPVGTRTFGERVIHERYRRGRDESD